MKKQINVQIKYYDSFYKGSSLWKKNIYLEKMIRSVVTKRGVVLEIGCGDGMLTQYLLDMGMKVLALDVSEVAIIVMEKRFSKEIKKGLLKMVNDDAINFLSKNPKKFDYILGSGIIHHIPDNQWANLFFWSKKRLKKGGWFWCCPEPNVDGIKGFFWKLAPFLYSKLFKTKYDAEVEKGTLKMKKTILGKSMEKSGNKLIIKAFKIFPDFGLKTLEKINFWMMNKFPKKIGFYVGIGFKKK